MEQLKTEIRSLPTTMVGGINYLSYQAVTNQVAAFFPDNGRSLRVSGDYQRLACGCRMEGEPGRAEKGGKSKEMAHVESPFPVNQNVVKVFRRPSM